MLARKLIHIHIHVHQKLTYIKTHIIFTLLHLPRGAVSLDNCGLRQLVRNSYDILGLQTYYTSGPTETRAWTIPKGSSAPKAAGVIHQDFERGFIRAEAISYDDLVRTGSEAEAKKKGLVRSEGKDYIVQEGDVLLFRFNV